MDTRPPENQDAENPPTLRLTDEQRTVFVNEAAARNADRLKCPVCGLMSAPEQTVCSRCGKALIETLTIPVVASTAVATDSPGDVIISDQAQLVLALGPARIAVPTVPALTVGRGGDDLHSTPPHIGLDVFAAFENGVSLRHLEIRRKAGLTYVVDLGSTNGTLLNGRWLQPHVQRLLRDRDELQLGQLRIQVYFQTGA